MTLPGLSWWYFITPDIYQLNVSANINHSCRILFVVRLFFSLPETNSLPFALENVQNPKRKGSSCNHWFSGANLLLVSGSVCFFRCSWRWLVQGHLGYWNLLTPLVDLGGLGGMLQRYIRALWEGSCSEIQILSRFSCHVLASWGVHFHVSFDCQHWQVCISCKWMCDFCVLFQLFHIFLGKLVSTKRTFYTKKTTFL